VASTYYFLASSFLTRYLRGVASKQIWMVTIAGKQTMERSKTKRD
jgi:hypothetical protein